MKKIFTFCSKRYIMAGLCALLTIVAAAFLCDTEVHAEDQKSQKVFVQAERASGTTGDIFDVNVTVSNLGEDLEGTVRLSVRNYNYSKCAYDTDVTLPRDSAKQFVLHLPMECVMRDMEMPEFYVQVLDRKGKVLLEEELDNLLFDEKDYLTIGILSDDFSSLTYFDLGGASIYYNMVDCPVKLYKLEADNLDNDLQGMDVLLVDQFRTDSIAGKQIDAIDSWIDGGGMLIVGTGRYAVETLTGLKDLLGLGVLDVSQDDPVAVASLEFETDMWWDYEEYKSVSHYAEMYYVPQGNGEIAVIPYCLAEVGNATPFTEEFATAVLELVISRNGKQYTYNNYYGYRNNALNQGNRLMSILNNSASQLNFSALNVIVFLYVVFAGPVLYLILRILKKREFYWVAVPVTAVVFIVIISLAGRGFEVKDTRVVSVSVAKADGTGNKKTYMLCYNAGHNEWKLKMDDDYVCAGPACFSGYDYSGDPFQYSYHVTKNGQGLFAGANPTQTFEDKYFCAVGKNKETGSIDVSDIRKDWDNFSGEICNNTEYDFKYVIVMSDDRYALYGPLPARGKMDLAGEKPVYFDDSSGSSNNSYSFTSDYFYDVLNDVYRRKEDMTATGRLAALGLGTVSLFSDETDFVIGLVENYDKAIDDRCAEMSYGCLYTTFK